MNDQARATERRWLVLSALLLNLAILPYPWLPPALEAWLPAVLALVAPAPLLAAFARSGGPARGAKLLALWFGGGGWWLILVDPKLGIFAWLFLVVSSMFWGLWLGAMLRLARERLGADRMLWLAPALWCGWELIRAQTALGTPWSALAHSWWRLPGLIQPAELTGYRGLSFVIAMVAAGFARLLLRERHAGRQLATGAALIAACWLYGLSGDREPPRGELRVALIQANIPLDWKQLGEPLDLFERHVDMTLEVPRGTDLAVWPETAVPSQIFALKGYETVLRQLAQSKSLTLVATGADLIPPDDPESEVWTNAAVIYDPQGRRVGHYHKVHLVVLGEYMPLRELPVFRWLAQQAPQYYGGAEFAAVPTPVGRLALPICYESVFAQDVAKMVRDGAELIVMMTNDDVLGQTGGRQHYQQSVFRAVEHRRWIARCANCGISGFIDPRGRIRETTRWGEQTVLTGDVALSQQTTLYTRLGEWFPTLLLALSAAITARQGGRPAVGKPQPGTNGHG